MCCVSRETTRPMLLQAHDPRVIDRPLSKREINGSPAHSRLIEEAVGRVGGHHLSEHRDEDQHQDGEELQQSCEGVLRPHHNTVSRRALYCPCATRFLNIHSSHGTKQLQRCSYIHTASSHRLMSRPSKQEEELWKQTSRRDHNRDGGFTDLTRLFLRHILAPLISSPSTWLVELRVGGSLVGVHVNVSCGGGEATASTLINL